MSFRLWSGLGKGALFALALLAGANFMLLSDMVVQRYASVFAVGRAMDKQLFTEQACPNVLLIGNSRVDNALDPRTIQGRLRRNLSVVNLGVPGANARVGYGMIKRLEGTGCLASGRLRMVVIGLDESYLRDEDALGYTPFFADRKALLDDFDWTSLAGTWLRLWSYTDNLRQLREPAKLLALIQATVEPTEPIGGAAWRYWGYRAGFGGANQNSGQVARQEVEAQRPPDASAVKYMYRILSLLDDQAIQTKVIFPPLLHRNSAYMDKNQAHGEYAELRKALEARGAKVVNESDPVPREPAYFVNAGHLNDRGAQIYSDWLGGVLVADLLKLGEESAP